ncbi:MAG: M20 family metallopeptidase [Microscillaceae bacterium]|nr:M20 family metallopeptidase [Microscillaceae bacterium]MDW8459614.1 M20 family metallopeptidase [Cytophagales bacterium]
MKTQIQHLAQQYYEQIVLDRRHLHAHPELSFKEKETARYIAERLKSIGLSPQENIAGHGVVAVIEGKNPQRQCVALRADIDALPIIEKNEVPYKSKNEGVMHACGHDVHTASLLGVAQILQDLRQEFEGSVKLIFQPAEEVFPGGASLMIKEGVLAANSHTPAPKSIIGQHVMPLLEVGKIGFREGVYMASTDEIYVTVKGKGGHGAMPELGIDPVLIASHIIIALQQIISRNTPPKIPAVLTFGKVIAQGATNIIPNEVVLEGTFRTLSEEWRYEAHRRMKKMAESIAEGMGGGCEFNIVVGYPSLKNDVALTQRLKYFAQEYVGKENVIDLDIWMAAEDFAYYSQVTDACFYRLGTRNEAKGITSGVHTNTFDIDEEALKIGAGLMAWLAVKELAGAFY